MRDFGPAGADELSLTARTIGAFGAAEPSCRVVGPDPISSPAPPVLCGARHWEMMSEARLGGSDTILASQDRMAVEVARACGVEPAVARTAMRRAQANNFAVFDPLLNSYAAAVFPWAAVLNHSCAPNCCVRFALAEGVGGPTLEFVALAEIAPGDRDLHAMAVPR